MVRQDFANDHVRWERGEPATPPFPSSNPCSRNPNAVAASSPEFALLSLEFRSSTSNDDQPKAVEEIPLLRLVLLKREHVGRVPSRGSAKQILTKENIL
jgi:hypothetical protein